MMYTEEAQFQEYNLLYKMSTNEPFINVKQLEYITDKHDTYQSQNFEQFKVELYMSNPTPVGDDAL